jgi:hypothetical protein
MARTYSDPSIGAKRTITMPLCASIDGTYQSAVDLVRHTFMFPASVQDFNLSVVAGGTDLGADVFFYLGKSLGGTGAVSAIGTADPLQGTGTYANASVLDASVTETAFTAGDDLVFQAIGTIGHAMTVVVNAEVIETFEVGDS